MRLITAAGSMLLRGSGDASSLAVSNKITNPNIHLAAASAIGQRGWIAISTTFRIGMARFRLIVNLSVGSGRVAIHGGKVGAGRPASI